jgi:hypothetical protein
VIKRTTLAVAALLFVGLVGGLVYANATIVRVDVPASVRIVKGVEGDADRDGAVDIGDMEFVAANLGPIPPSDPTSDLNSDGVVDIRDMVIVAKNFQG